MKSLLTLSLLTALALNFSSFADGKGAERLNASGKPAVTVASGAAASRMTCATETRTVVDRTARGAVKPTKLVTTHLCPTCKTETSTKGVGKMAMHTTSHSCKAVAACCK